MKKIIIVFTLLLSVLFLNGCIFSDSSYMELIETKVYDSNGIEIHGEIEYEYDLYEKLNSPAPTHYFYCYNIEKDSEYTVKMYFNTNKNKILKSVDLYDQNSEFIMKANDVKDSSLENTCYLITFTILLNANRLYETKYWYDDEGNKNTFELTYSGGRFRGVCFFIDQIEDSTCI